MSRTPTRPVPRRARRAVLRLGFAVAAATLATASGVAYGQSGGTVSPGPTTASPAPPTASGGPSQVFPVPVKHSFGDGFGAGRGHQGVDIFAPCGSFLIAVTNARVVRKAFQSRAGNYVVLRNKKLKRDYVYMHMQAPSPLRKKQKVVPGQFVGAMGDTGRASGCHLHFEIWKGKWYRGGRAINPMSSLLSWDAYS